MNKSKLNNIIKKYNLNGSVETVKYVFDAKKNLSIDFISSDRTVLGSLTAKDVDIEESEFGIYETSNLKNLLKVLGDDVTVTLKRDSNSEVQSVQLKDKVGIKAKFGTCAFSAIPVVPQLSSKPTYNLEIQLDETFIDKFIKAKSALPESKLFTTVKDGKSVKIVIGHSSNNTNQISLPIKTVKGKDSITKETSFSAEKLKEIFLANSDVKDAVLKISDEGLALTEFSSDGMDLVYYLPEIEPDDAV